MISVAAAQEKIPKLIPRGTRQTVPLGAASGRFLAATIRSSLDLPPFSQSAMDGYALKAEETIPATVKLPVILQVVSSIAAGGNPPNPPLSKGGAIRILTGAMIPPGADAVIKQEEVTVSEGRIVVTRPVELSENIRPRGEEVRKGDLLLEEGTPLTPASIGLLASIGQENIPVFAGPRVGILVTGSEIVTSAPSEGKIFDSNSFSLTAALNELRLCPSWIKRSADDKTLLSRHLAEGAAETDCLITTGGVSVGDFDFVREVSTGLGFEEIFWQVKQKPGRPIYFSKTKSGKFLFGLPGNPASALVCFYEYVRPALLTLMGSRTPFLPAWKVPLVNRFHKKQGLRHFLKGRLVSQQGRPAVEILDRQASHMMTSFATADCLVVISEDSEEIKAGDEVEIHLLPR